MHEVKKEVKRHRPKEERQSAAIFTSEEEDEREEGVVDFYFITTEKPSPVKKRSFFSKYVTVALSRSSDRRWQNVAVVVPWGG